MGIQKVLVTIITESVLETDLIEKLETLGVNGYTIFDVRGKGSQGSRAGDWQESANIQIEIVCNESIANNIMVQLQEEYFPNYAMIVYQTPAMVLRSEKF